MKKFLFIENIKCGGCAKSIVTSLSKVVKDVEVDEVGGNVSFTYMSEHQIDQVIASLERLGYPEVGKSNLSHKAKSYLSCMVGRVIK